jgi:hypothetical protein
VMPVLIIAYRRIASTDDLIRECILSGATKIYLAIDGPKATNDDISREFIQIIEKYLLAYPGIEIAHWLREENLGSANSVISAIDWALRSEISVAIFEDDLVISRDLLTYFDQNISKLNVENTVMLAGTNPFYVSGQDNANLDTHFPIVWGWATTRTRWHEMRKGLLSNSLNYKKRRPKKIVSFLEVGRIRAQSKTIDAWDVPLAAWMYAEQKKCILPPRNLVSNRGFDINSTHTLDEKWPLNLPLAEQTPQPFTATNSLPLDGQSLDREMAIQVLAIKRRHTFSIIKLFLRIFLGFERVDVSALSKSLEKIAMPCER